MYVTDGTRWHNMRHCCVFPSQILDRISSSTELSCCTDRISECTLHLRTYPMCVTFARARVKLSAQQRRRRTQRRNRMRDVSRTTITNQLRHARCGRICVKLGPQSVCGFDVVMSAYRLRIRGAHRALRGYAALVFALMCGVCCMYCIEKIVCMHSKTWSKWNW